MSLLVTKVKRLDGSTMCAPKENISHDMLEKGMFIQWRVDYPYEVEVYPHVFMEKQKYLKAKIIDFNKTECDIIYVNAEEVEVDVLE